MTSTKSSLPASASQSQRFVDSILRASSFENVMGLVIVINFVIIIIETDNSAADRDTEAWLEIASWSLLGTFIVELSLKLFAHRMRFWREFWNSFDFVVISVDTVMSLLSLMNKDLFSVSALRILRLSRL